MGSDLAKALSQPFEAAVHDCAQLSRDSDCSMSGCCACHSKTIAPEAEDGGSEPEGCAPEVAEIEIKEKG